jgi:hypothetical protein
MNPSSDPEQSLARSKLNPLELSGLVEPRLQLGYSPKGEKTILFATKSEGDSQTKSFIRSKDIIGNMYSSAYCFICILLCLLRSSRPGAN